MRLDLLPDGMVLTLSRRNLLALLAKLEEHGSGRAIASGNAYWCDTAIDGVQLIVRSEPDSEHYRDREPAGGMTLETEARISWAEARR